MLPDESLLIYCKAFQEACTDRYPNITIKKIPNMLLGRCEFGKEDYSLNIVNVPLEQGEFSVGLGQELEDPALDDHDEFAEEDQLSLFGEEVEDEPDCQ